MLNFAQVNLHTYSLIFSYYSLMEVGTVDSQLNPNENWYLEECKYRYMYYKTIDYVLLKR